VAIDWLTQAGGLRLERVIPQPVKSCGPGNAAKLETLCLREVVSLLKFLCSAAFSALAGVLFAQSVPHASGVVHTPAVDIGYETFGTSGTALPVIAVNGGPGLTHAYMLMNDMWQQVAGQRLVVFYDQRGTGASRHVQPGASQDMTAQVADLEAVRAQLGLDKAAFVGDSYGGLLVMAYAAAHPEHVAKMVLSDSAPPAWKDLVHLLPQTFPDVEEQTAEEGEKLGAGTDTAARRITQSLPDDLLLTPKTGRVYGSHGESGL
jgi:proline iminopeptidase